MKKILYIPTLLAVFAFAGGCKEEPVAKYDNDPRLYFYKGNIASEGRVQEDTTRMTFLDVPAEEEYYDVQIEVRTVGFPADRPRYVSFEQVNTDEAGAAGAGKHYVSFDDPQMKELMIVPAGAVRALIPVRVTRDESLENNRFRLAIRIVPNDDFGAGFSDQIDHVVVVSEMYEQPDAWDFWSTAFGQWGQKKMWFITQIVGFNGMDSYNYSPSFRRAMQIRAITLLEEYNNDPGNPDLPLSEEDGTQVTFPNA